MITRSLADRVRASLRVIADYPKPGIQFQDITPVLADGPLFQEVVAAMAAPFAGAGVTHVLGIEARYSLGLRGITEQNLDIRNSLWGILAEIPF